MLGGDSFVIAGEYMTLSDPESGVRDASRAIRFGCGSDTPPVKAGGVEAEAGTSTTLLSDVSVLADRGSSVVGELANVFF